MIRTVVILSATSVFGYLLAGWVLEPLSKQGGERLDQAATAWSASVRESSGHARAPGPTRDPAGPQPMDVRVNIPENTQCAGDLRKLPDEALGRLPFADRKALEQFAAEHPGYASAVRRFTREALREAQYAVQSCYAAEGGVDPLPVLLEFTLETNTTEFSLTRGTVLKISGSPANQQRAQRCLETMLAGTYRASAPDLGKEPMYAYRGPMPWSLGLGL
jgi:hypothetical protein